MLLRKKPRQVAPCACELAAERMRTREMSVPGDDSRAFRPDDFWGTVWRKAIESPGDADRGAGDDVGSSACGLRWERGGRVGERSGFVGKRNRFVGKWLNVDGLARSRP